MNKEALRANKQRAFIQDSIRAAFRENIGDGPTVHPFVLAVQSLRREIEFMQPFTVDEMKEMFKQAEPTYKSATTVLEQAEQKVFGDSEVSTDADQMLPLVEYHLNLLKIHRLLFTRQVEGYGLIPPASATLQRQVVRTYEALGQLTDVITSFIQAPKVEKKKVAEKSTVRTRKLASKSSLQETEEPLDMPMRVSPFITDGTKKSTVAIDGVVWPRFV